MSSGGGVIGNGIKIWECEAIPQHIIELIFSKLPIVNLPNCRLVSRTWNHMVSDYASHSKSIPNTYILFKSMHRDEPRPWLSGQSKDMHCIELDGTVSEEMNVVVVGSFRFSHCYFDIRISNSCNGLLCVINGMNYKRTCAGILNPMTTEYIKLPSSAQFFDKVYFYGFGFSSERKHYKVARISQAPLNYGCVVEIFTLDQPNILALGQGNAKWGLSKLLSFTVENDGVYFDGVLYWAGQDEKRNKIICCLDVEDESFEIIHLPNPNCYSLEVGLLNDGLYTTFRREPGDYKFEVWTMQNHGGKENQDSWIRKFVVDDIPKCWKWKLGELLPWKRHLQLIKVGENGEILCLFDNFYLFSYNPETGKIKAYEKQDQSSLWIYQIESISFDSLQTILLSG